MKTAYSQHRPAGCQIEDRDGGNANQSGNKTYESRRRKRGGAGRPPLRLGAVAPPNDERDVKRSGHAPAERVEGKPYSK